MESNFIAFGQPNFTEEEINAVEKVMNSGWVGMGSETLAFEENLLLILERKNVITVNSHININSITIF